MHLDSQEFMWAVLVLLGVIAYYLTKIGDDMKRHHDFVQGRIRQKEIDKTMAELKDKADYFAPMLARYEREEADADARIA